MEIDKYLTKMKNIQKDILSYIEDENNNESFQQNLEDIYKNLDNQFELNEFLHLLVKISNNYHRSQTFYYKIEHIISLFKGLMQKYLSSFEIFNIFKINKRILLYLFEEKLIYPDKRIFNILKNDKYQQKNYLSYFYPEFKTFFSESEKLKFENMNEMIENNIDLFERNRKTGENDSYICNLIRNDLITDFITLINRKNYSIKSKLNSSIFETNSFLLNKNPTLIEYSAFFGSIQIFRYLVMNNADLNSSLWSFAIHGKNPEIIHFLEENKVHINNVNEIVFESIKCHHIEFTNYIKENLLNDQDEEDLYDLLNTDESKTTNKKSNDEFQTFLACLKYNNYTYIQPNNLFDESIFYYLCKYDYCYLVKMLIQNLNLNINHKKISNNFHSFVVHIFQVIKVLKMF